MLMGGTEKNRPMVNGTEMNEIMINMKKFRFNNKIKNLMFSTCPILPIVH